MPLRGPAMGLMVVAAAWACATPVAENPFQESRSAVKVSLRVENRNLHDATVYSYPGGRRQELGTVTSRGVAFLEFSWPAQQPLNLEVELSVGERFRFQPRPLAGAGRVDMIVAANLRQSVLSMY